ncbi:MAG: DUF5681 domain-containing protein [Aestuariivirga sp.]
MSEDQGTPTPQPQALSSAPTYDVGYGKPPAQTRFLPGQSGNPQGRPKAKASLAQSLSKALFKKIKIPENGKVKSVTVLDAMMMTTCVMAVKGNMQAAKLLTGVMADYKVSAEPLPACELIIRFLEPPCSAKIAEWEKEN